MRYDIKLTVYGVSADNENDAINKVVENLRNIGTDCTAYVDKQEEDKE